ncbi:MAG TPA: glycosyl hydrolase [Candidatus Krumholzibacteria bacterium]|nr:glycosyl hydrolase [Candidatus Krumholzibacteria bacterium]
MRPRQRARASRRTQKPVVLVGTRKGAFFLTGDAARRTWKLTGPHFLGHIVHHAVLDPRDGRTMLLAVRTGHLGPTVFGSQDWGRTWQEASQPPAFAPGGSLAVQHVFWLTPGHAEQPGVWFAGTSPQGLFRSDDAGKTWEGVRGFNTHPRRNTWAGGDGTPDGPTLHSILIDPRDPRHMYFGMSSGGVFETRDGGKDWRPLNQGILADFLPDKYPEFGQDPHCIAMHPLHPDRLYHQNHCGIYRLDRPGEKWERIGKNMPRAIGDIGFPIVLHPRDPDTLWVFPMDGSTVWPRTSPGGKPAVYRTRDGGRSWQRQARGLPQQQAWFTVKRQAFAADAGEPVGLYFGTTSGEVWTSADGGQRWARLAAHLPEIYSITTGVRG